MKKKNNLDYSFKSLISNERVENKDAQYLEDDREEYPHRVKIKERG